MKKQTFHSVPLQGSGRPVKLCNSERSSLPSMTMPEQITPLERLLSHRNQGIPVPWFNGVFSEQDTPDLSKMDFIEIAQLKETTQEGIELAKQDLHAIEVQLQNLLKPVPTPEEIGDTPKPKAPEGASA